MYTESSREFSSTEKSARGIWQKTKPANEVLNETPNTSDDEVRKELADQVTKGDCVQVVPRNVYQAEDVA